MAPVGAYSGSGTADNPYEISSVADLKQLASDVNADTDAKTYENTYFKLTADLDLNNEEWTPIGNGRRSDSQHTGKSFSGTFDGAGHTISNLKITSGDSSNAVGLFGVLNGGTVKNLVLSNVQITLSSCKNAGAAIGLMVNGATAENIYVSSGSVSAADGAGGIVGRMTISGTIKDCINSATVSAAGGGAGGIVGKAYYTATGKVMTIQNCINTGDVTSTYAAGGIVGLSAANVNGCMNTGTISAGVEAGGIIGEQCQYGVISGNSNSGTISNTDVTGKGDNANGEVSGSTGTTYGGIIGWIRYNYKLTSPEYPLTAPISVTDNTNSGSIEATDCSLGAGGIVGSIYNNASVTGNINLATSVKGGVFAAGIVGNAQTNSANAYYDTLGITVENNYVGTIEEQITVSNGGICKDLFCYNNNVDPFNVQSKNIQLTAQTLTASTTAGGSMGISPSSPNKGQIVTITVTPYNNYEFGSLTVEGATPVKVGDKYLFMMPDNAVTVTPTFTEKTVVAKIGGT
ncbi:MAG: hypothetical protein IKT36_06570, partial [Methanocorpusculum sp.]|nr:hypothetical protein [Methanocorpusculum sp.]